MSDTSGWAAPASPVPPDPYATPAAPPYAAAPSTPAYGSGGYAPPPAGQPYAPQPHAQPYAQQPYGQQPYAQPYAQGWATPRRLGRVTGLGTAVLAVSALLLLLDLVEALTSVEAARRFSAAAEAGLEQPFVLYDGVSVLVGLVQLAGVVLTGLWLLAVRRNVEQVAPGSQRRGPAWAFLGWVVPVVSLWFPYQVVADAGRASTRRSLAYGAWWGLFLAYTGAQQVALALLGGVTGGVTGDIDPELVRALPVAEAASVVLLAAAFVLWARIVVGIGRAHDRWAATQVPTLD